MFKLNQFWYGLIYLSNGQCHLSSIGVVTETIFDCILNSADHDQTADVRANQGLHCLLRQTQLQLKG